jgi:hypothetical protein
MKVTPLEIISLIIGLFSLVSGILLFSGSTKWGKRNYRIGDIELTNEVVGFILFFIGIVLILGFLVPLLSIRFSSPGMEGY